MLASVGVFAEHARAAGLALDDPRFFGQDYARTLDEWHRRVWQARDRIRQMFDDRFLRMWRFYLSYCEAGFRHKRIDLMQVTLRKPA
jgi:cyclopropane-fatty-acyl-phospholipid synthase